MSLISRLGYTPNKKKNIEVIKHINVTDMSLIIPVKDNQRGINILLKHLENDTVYASLLKEVIIVDNLSENKIKVNSTYSFNVIVCECNKPGPAAARNRGVELSTGSWLLFMDSDCIPTKKTLISYCTNENNCIAYAGNVNISNITRLNKYYKSQEILIPPEAIDRNESRPDYLITANCLVYKKAFLDIGGFDESFLQAGGEDIDLAFRLLTIGSIEYQWDSIILHNFDDGLKGFIKRFERYGKGNKQIALKYDLDLAPKMFLPEKLTFSNIVFSLLQFYFMRKGYKFLKIE